MERVNSSTFNSKTFKSFVANNIIILLVFLFANILVRYSLDEQLGYTYRSEFQESILIDGVYDYVSVGTSHGINSIDFNSHRVHEINLAKAGQPFKYDLEKLYFYERFIDNKTVVIVPISFHSFCLDNEEWLPHEVIYNYSFPILGMSRILTLRTYITTTADELAGNLMSFNAKNDFIIPPDCDVSNAKGYLELIIQEHENVVLITTPYLSQYLGSYQDFNNFYSIVSELSENYNVDYIDYSRDERFQNLSYFNDATHLNSIGRGIFTNILISDLEELLNPE
jgi:hypothetical protein